MNAYSREVDALERLLDERAQHLARTLAHERVRQVVHEIAEVQVADTRLGIEATMIREITPIGRVTRFPGQPSCLRGLTQVRGELMCMVDTAVVMGIADAPEPRFSVVVQASSGCIALAVQAVNRYRGVFADELIDGFCANDSPLLSVTHDFVSILDLARLVESDAVLVP